MKNFMQLILAALFTFSLAACGDNADTPAEKVGETMEAATDAVTDAVDNDGPMENAGEAVDDAMSDAKEAMEEAGEDMKDAAEEAGDKMDAMAEDFKG